MEVGREGNGPPEGLGMRLALRRGAGVANGWQISRLMKRAVEAQDREMVFGKTCALDAWLALKRVGVEQSVPRRQQWVDVVQQWVDVVQVLDLGLARNVCSPGTAGNCCGQVMSCPPLPFDCMKESIPSCTVWCSKKKNCDRQREFCQC